MTKKHFEALAAALAESKRAYLGRERMLLQWSEDVGAVADVCARFNPNFDRARFLKACGVEEAK